MIRSGFSRVFWGALVVAIDVRLNEFDVFVDLVGWLLIVSGLGLVRPLGRRFGTARGWALLAALLSVLDLGWLDTQYVIRESGSVTWSWDHVWPVRLVQMWCSLAAGWLICRGCADRAEEQGLPDLAAKARSRGGWIVAVHVLGALVMMVAWAAPDLAAVALFLIPVALVVGLLFLGLLRRAGRELHVEGPPGL